MDIGGLSPVVPDDEGELRERIPWRQCGEVSLEHRPVHGIAFGLEHVEKPTGPALADLQLQLEEEVQTCLGLFVLQKYLAHELLELLDFDASLLLWLLKDQARPLYQALESRR